MLRSMKSAAQTGLQSVILGTKLKAAEFLRAKEGNIAILFSFMIGVLMLFVGGAVDYTRYNAVRADLIESMDAAGLAMAQIDAFNGPEIRELEDEARETYLKEQGRRFFLENFKHAAIVTDLEVDFDLLPADIVPKATGRVRTLFLHIGQRVNSGTGSSGYLKLSAETRIARRNDGNIEVTLVMDLTGSMGGQRISDLRNAAKEMVDIVVRDDQEEWYSKVALVPYSMGVNVAGYANEVRGPIAGPVTISNVSDGTVGSKKNITDVEKRNPVRVTANNHGFQNGDRVWIEGVRRSGGSGSCRLDCQINDNVYTVTGRTSNTFELQGVNGNNWSGSYSSSNNDWAIKCASNSPDCEVVITATSHGFSTNDYVHINGVSGMTEINNNVSNSSVSDDVWRITRLDNNTFRLNDSIGPAYSSYNPVSGSAWCTNQGCQYYYFTNMSNQDRAFQVTSCVTERVGSNQYTDAAPSTTYVGRLYKGSENDCPSSPIIPLSTNKNALKASIDTYQAAGSTAGQIGVAWGWYLLSPEFGYLFSDDSQPAPYTDEDTTKVAVIMTDGEFNTPYRNGVIAQDAASGSGSNTYKIKLNSSNGSPYTQAESICAAMKNAGVLVYTIGFDISNSQDVIDLLTNCATSEDTAYFAATGAELFDIYRQIGSEITKLHISK